RLLAALAPRVLRLSAERAAGAHPYLVTPEHTRQARQILGDGPLLAPEQKLVLGTDPEQARAIARPRVQNPYLSLTNYLSNLRKLGWTDADLAGRGGGARRAPGAAGGGRRPAAPPPPGPGARPAGRCGPSPPPPPPRGARWPPSSSCPAADRGPGPPDRPSVLIACVLIDCPGPPSV